MRCESLSTRRWWRPPAKSVVEEGVDAGLGHFDADQPRAQRDDVGVVMLRAQARPTAARDTSAQRHAGLRLTAIEMPIPDPHTAMPRSARPSAIASASIAP